METNVQFDLRLIRKVSYLLNLSNGLYVIHEPSERQKKVFPGAARLEPPMQYPNCWKVIRGKRETWDKTIWTGLIVLSSYGKHINRWYYGDMLIQGKKTLLAFMFSLDYEEMNVYVFNPGYYPWDPKYRDRVLFQFAQLIEKPRKK